MDQNPTPEQPPVVAPVTPGAPVVENPGKTFGIISLVLSLIGAGVIGIILGIIGLKKSAAVGLKNGLALAGIIVGAVSTVLGIIFISLAIAAAAALVSKCGELGSGPHMVDGVTYNCPASSTSVPN